MDGYDKINRRFEKAVTMLQENLQYLADETKVSDRFISLHNGIIKALIDYQHLTTEIIEDLQYENYHLALKKSKECRELEDIKISFEAICLLHGIVDFVAWMAKGKDYLITMAVDHYRDGTIQVPYQLMELIDRLSEQERNTVMTILMKKGQERWRNELEALARKPEKRQYAGT